MCSMKVSGGGAAEQRPVTGHDASLEASQELAEAIKDTAKMDQALKGGGFTLLSGGDGSFGTNKELYKQTLKSCTQSLQFAKKTNQSETEKYWRGVLSNLIRNYPKMADEPEVRDAVKSAKSALGFAGRTSLTLKDLAFGVGEAVNTLGKKVLGFGSSLKTKIDLLGGELREAIQARREVSAEEEKPPSIEDRIAAFKKMESSPDKMKSPQEKTRFIETARQLFNDIRSNQIDVNADKEFREKLSEATILVVREREKLGQVDREKKQVKKWELLDNYWRDVIDPSSP